MLEIVTLLIFIENIKTHFVLTDAKTRNVSSRKQNSN